MLTALLCILFSKTLTFSGLTISGFMAWLNYHPIIANIFAIDLVFGVAVIFRTAFCMLNDEDEIDEVMTTENFHDMIDRY